MRILYNKRGILLTNGKFRKLLMPGFYPLTNRKNLNVYDVNEVIRIENDSTMALLDDKLKDQVEIRTVHENELLLVFKDELFYSIITRGRYAFWKNGTNFSHTIIDLNSPIIGDTIDRQILSKDQVKQFVASFCIESYETGLLYIEKKYVKSLDPGNYFFWKGNKSVNIQKIDLRQKQLEISGQEIMTKDKVNLRLNFICQYRVNDPIKLIHEKCDYEVQLYAKMQLLLREYIGTLTFDEILDKKEEINNFILTKLKSESESDGYDIIFSGIKDVILPGDIKEIINEVLVAEKKAQANVIMRREETASTRSLLNTAKLMENNEILLKLKELEYTERISEKVNQISINGNGQILDQLKDLLTHIKG